MNRPSAPLIERIQQILQQNDLSVSAASLRSGIGRVRLEAVLSGDEPMTVDELITLSESLSLSPEDFGLPMPEKDSLYEAPDSAALADRVSATFEVDGLELMDVLDPEASHASQLFQAGFGLGCTFVFQAEVNALAGSGVPKAILNQYAGRELTIQLDAAFHVHNEPVFDADGVTIRLSFDAIYTCTFPWHSIRRVIFLPVQMEPPAEDDSEEPTEPDRPTFLRLVE